MGHDSPRPRRSAPLAWILWGGLLLVRADPACAQQISPGPDAAPSDPGSAGGAGATRVPNRVADLTGGARRYLQWTRAHTTPPSLLGRRRDGGADPLIWLFPDHPQHRRRDPGESLELADFLNEEEKTTFGAQQGGNRGQPDFLGPLLDRGDPAIAHFLLDRALGLDTRQVSHLPKAPELPEPIYYDLMRPLGALKYDGEVNYLIAPFAGPSPTLQLIELEYVMADWRAPELQLNYNNGRFVAMVPGYQRTLGVGPRGNWVHAYQIQVPIYVEGHKVGGRAAYIAAWQPDEESPWGVYLYAGAERVAVDRRVAAGPITGGPVLGPAAVGGDPPGSFPGAGAAGSVGVWRPLAALDVFYTLNEQLSIGVENDAFIHSRFGNYVVLPQVQWQPLVHLSVKLGAGWFRIGDRSEAAFMCRVMITQPSPRRPRDDYDPAPNRRGQLRWGARRSGPGP